MREIPQVQMEMHFPGQLFIKFGVKVVENQLTIRGWVVLPHLPLFQGC